MELFKYENRLVRITHRSGDVFTGVAAYFPADYGLREFDREEAGIRIGGYTVFESDIAGLALLPGYEEAVAAIPPGRYRHFKGREYEVIGIARHSETEEPMVVYRPLYGDGGLWVRPASMWNETVVRNGEHVTRFVKAGE